MGEYFDSTVELLKGRTLDDVPMEERFPSVPDTSSADTAMIETVRVNDPQLASSIKAKIEIADSVVDVIEAHVRDRLPKNSRVSKKEAARIARWSATIAVHALQHMEGSQLGASVTDIVVNDEVVLLDRCRGPKGKGEK